MEVNIYILKNCEMCVLETSSTPTFEEAFDQKMKAEGQAHPQEHLDIFQW